MGISSSQMEKDTYQKRVAVVVEEIAQTFIREINKGELASPKFSALMNFRAMQNMTSNQVGSENFRYWQERDWLDAEYYTKVKINPLARIMAGRIARKMRESTRNGNLKPIR
jgi:hypothetical protein